MHYAIVFRKFLMNSVLPAWDHDQHTGHIFSHYCGSLVWPGRQLSAIRAHSWPKQRRNLHRTPRVKTKKPTLKTFTSSLMIKFALKHFECLGCSFSKCRVVWGYRVHWKSCDLQSHKPTHGYSQTTSTFSSAEHSMQMPLASLPASPTQPRTILH